MIRDLITNTYHQYSNKLPRLEIEILLSNTLKRPREYLFSHDDETVSNDDQYIFYSLIERRILGEPIAYILGYKEFWSLPIKVSKDVLIPRPETELLIECILKITHDKTSQSLTVLDLGTGSGAIALAIAKERPHWKIIATDQSKDALTIAKQNAQDLSLNNIEFYLGDWFNALNNSPYNKSHFDIVVSNPPYIEINDSHLLQGDLRFEPKNALISGQNGMQDLKYIIEGAKHYLKINGCLILEHGYEQNKKVDTIMKTQNFVIVSTHKDLAGVNRVTLGYKV